MKSSNAWLTEVDIDVTLAWWAHNSNAFHFRTLRNYNTAPSAAKSLGVDATREKNIYCIEQKASARLLLDS